MDRILVIEDDDASRKALRRLFSSEGYEVDVAPDGNAVLEMFRQKTPIARSAPGNLLLVCTREFRRASRVSPEDVYVFEDVIVDFSKAEVTCCDKKVTVTA